MSQICSAIACAPGLKCDAFSNLTCANAAQATALMCESDVCAGCCSDIGPPPPPPSLPSSCMLQCTADAPCAIFASFSCATAVDAAALMCTSSDDCAGCCATDAPPPLLPPPPPAAAAEFAVDLAAEERRAVSRALAEILLGSLGGAVALFTAVGAAILCRRKVVTALAAREERLLREAAEAAADAAGAELCTPNPI